MITEEKRENRVTVEKGKCRVTEEKREKWSKTGGISKNRVIV